MAGNTNILLDDHSENFIANQIESGRFGSVSEVVRAALGLLEDTETKVHALRKALDTGEQSGVANYEYGEFMVEVDREIDQ